MDSQAAMKSSNQKLDYVASYLLTAFGNEADNEQDSTIKSFLLKLYKNNISTTKPKRMNSIRLNRFNALLYRFCCNFPDDSDGSFLIYSSLVAAFLNNKNFQEEEDQETVASIVKWTCSLMKKSIEYGHHLLVLEFLQFLVEDVKPTLPPLQIFEQQLQKCKYLMSMELSQEDEMEAVKDEHIMSLTAFINPRIQILEQMKLDFIYGSLYESSASKLAVLKLFLAHCNLVPKCFTGNSKIFGDIFLQEEFTNSTDLEAFLETLNKFNFNSHQIQFLANKLANIQTSLAPVFQITLNCNRTEEMFIESFCENSKKIKDIENIVKTFLDIKKPANLIGLNLMLRAIDPIPKRYISLLAQQHEPLYKHAIIFALAVSTNIQHRPQDILIDLYLSRESVFDPARKKLIVRGIHYALTGTKKVSLIASICRANVLEQLNQPATLDFLVDQEAKADKLSNESKRKLITLLENYKDEDEQSLRLKVELLSLCGSLMPLTTKVRSLNAIFSQPLEDILKQAENGDTWKDPQYSAAYLMGVNNKLQIHTVEQVSQETLTALIRYFLNAYNGFGREVANFSFQNNRCTIVAQYYQTLAQYQFHYKNSINPPTDEIGRLLDGATPYRRLQEFNFAQFLIGQEKGQKNRNLWAMKRILYELKTILTRLINFEKIGNNSLKKELRGLLEDDWGIALGFKLIQRYLDAQIDDKKVLRTVLATFQPNYAYFEIAEKQFACQFEQYIDILQYIPRLLQNIYPETLKYLSQLITSENTVQPQSKDNKDKTNEKKRSKKKNNSKQKEREKQYGKNDIVVKIEAQKMSIFDNQSLFQRMNQHNQLRYLFGDASLLQNFDSLCVILEKIVDRNNMINAFLNDWLPTLQIFHCQSGQIENWKIRLLSYCRFWEVVLSERRYKLPVSELERHFLIITELLNTLYEVRSSDSAEIESKVLVTLLLIYQASLPEEIEKPLTIPRQSLKNLLLNFRIPPPTEAHYYNCFTCSLSVCHICAPFLHKNHDLNFTGKDGSCVHDAQGNRLPVPADPSRMERERDRNERLDRLEREREKDRMERGVERMERFGVGGERGYRIDRVDRMERVERMERGQRFPGGFSAALQANQNFGQGLISRNVRKEDDFFAQAFELGDQEIDFGDHLRFREAMQGRFQQRERERDYISLRDRERQQRQEIERLQEEIEQQKEMQMPEVTNQIRSQSSKSIRNIECKANGKYVFKPEFNTDNLKDTKIACSFDARPLRKILLREVQWEGNDEATKGQSGKTTSQLNKERYIFFNKSTYFRSSNRGDYGMMRANNSNLKRNLLSSNKKFLVFPSASNGILLLSMTNIINKLGKRQLLRNFGEVQQERAYLTNAVNNSSINFEPYQILFSRCNPCLLAVVGSSQFGFLLLSQQGKIQKWMQADFKSTEPITKFQWMSKHKNIFALSIGTSIRIGNISEDLKVKSASKFRVHLDKSIRDFDLSTESTLLYAYIIDQDGQLYRTEFDYHDPKIINAAQRKLTFPAVGPLQNLIVLEKKLLVSSSDGKCHLLRLDGKISPPALLESFDLEAAMKGLGDGRFKGPLCFWLPKIVMQVDNTFSIACILKRAGEPKRKTGWLAILRVSGHYNLQTIILSEEELVESFEVSIINENSFVITAVEENGSVWVFPYSVPAELLSIKQNLKYDLSESMVPICNKTIKQQDLLFEIGYYQPRRFTNFPDTKDITGTFKIDVSNSRLHLISNHPNRFFVTGISLIFDPPADQIGRLSFSYLQKDYNYEVLSAREIQIPFNIKQTLQLFVMDTQVRIPLVINGTIRQVRVFGVEFSNQSIFHKAYSRLYRLVTIHLQYDFNNIEHYLDNSERMSIVDLHIMDFLSLKSSQRYTSKELNLLLKLQLLRLTVEPVLKNQREVEDTLQAVRTYLLPLCQKRQFLQRSCCKLVKRLSLLLLNESSGIIGHPFEYKTILDFQYFERSYQQMMISRNLQNFESTINFLYCLIFKRVANLYLLFKLNPSLIYEITFFYKSSLQSMRHQKSADQESSHLRRLINICPNYVALVCEYYQTLKNSHTHGMVSEQNEKSPEKVVLDLLEEVFCAIKKELYREIFISPELYLEKLYLSKREPHILNTAINIFAIEFNEQEPKDHASRKASLNQPDPIEDSEEEIELEEESQKQMLDEQAREMIDIQEKADDIRGNQMEIQQPSSESNDVYKTVTSILNNFILKEGESTGFIYYQFSFEMITALFNLDDCINRQNAVFYIGFLFNLLRIVETNLDPERDGIYLNRLFDAFHRRLSSPAHSVLYMALNFFFEPKYSSKLERGRIIIHSQTRLAAALHDYYRTNNIDIANIFLEFKVKKSAPTVSMSNATKFVPFELENQIYQLKFLGNLYLTIRQFSPKDFVEIAESLKIFVLGVVVRYKLRVFNNIMLLEGWSGELESAKVDVGFETTKENLQLGIQLLNDCVQSNPSMFVKKLSADLTKVAQLEDLLLETGGNHETILNMLTTYYTG